MADSKTQKAATADEKLFTIPLRKEFLKVPKNRRAKRSMNTIRAFLSRHMKVPETEVRISPMLNQNIWVRGAAKPPSKVRIKATLDMKEGLLFASMPDEKPPSPKDDTQKGTGKKAEAKPPVDKDAVKELLEKATAKATGKEEIKKLVDQAVAEGKSSEKPAEPKKAESEKPAEKPKAKKPAETKKAKPEAKKSPEKK